MGVNILFLFQRKKMFVTKNKHIPNFIFGKIIKQLLLCSYTFMCVCARVYVRVCDAYTWGHWCFHPYVCMWRSEKYNDHVFLSHIHFYSPRLGVSVSRSFVILAKLVDQQAPWSLLSLTLNVGVIDKCSYQLILYHCLVFQTRASCLHSKSYLLHP